VSQLSRKCGSSTSHNPTGHLGLLQGYLYTVTAVVVVAVVVGVVVVVVAATAVVVVVAVEIVVLGQYSVYDTPVHCNKN
jgi:hypothetical protein